MGYNRVNHNFEYFSFFTFNHSKVSRTREFRSFARENIIYAIYDNSRLGALFVRNVTKEINIFSFESRVEKNFFPLSFLSFFSPHRSNPNYFIRTQRFEYITILDNIVQKTRNKIKLEKRKRRSTHRPSEGEVQL